MSEMVEQLSLFGELTDLDYRTIIQDYVEKEIVNGDKEETI